MAKTLRILLTRREITRRVLIDRAIGRATNRPRDTTGHTLPEHDESMSPELFHDIFTPENIDLLAKLRGLGHVDLATAAKAFDLNVDEFVAMVMDKFMFNLLHFHPIDGKPGVEVPFDSISINLDFG